MSLAKVSGGTLAAAIALVLSTSANAYLLLRSPAAHEALPPKPAPPRSTPPATIALSAFGANDPATLRDQLREAGVNESTARGIIEAILRRRYREKLSAQRGEMLRHGWWNDPSWFYQPALVSGVPRLADDQQLLRTMVFDPLDQLFGPDPLEIATREAKFGFLPPEKRQAFVAFERHYDATNARLSADERTGPAGARLRAERASEEKRLLDSLTPEEQDEHRLRLSADGSAARTRMSQIEGAERDYREVMTALAPLQIPATLQRGDIEKHALERLTSALGYDRAVDYLWAGASEHPNIARAAREANLPASTASRVLQLAAETTQRAIAIHADSTKSPEQKRADMQALQREVQPALDSLLPPEQQRTVGGDGLLWFTALAEGRYKRLQTTSGVSNAMVISPSTYSVEKPPVGSLGQQFSVPRSTTTPVP